MQRSTYNEYQSGSGGPVGSNSADGVFADLAGFAWRALRWKRCFTAEIVKKDAKVTAGL
ncbi:MAG: hypothetical protein ABJA02_14945 [Acidobacteriota bacterium]